MNTAKITEPKNKNSQTSSPSFGKESERTDSKESNNIDHDVLSPLYAHNFSKVQVESDQSNKLSSPPQIQTKLKINKPGDKYEQEADRVAEQIMLMPDPQVNKKTQISGNSQTPQIQRMCSECEEEEEEIQIKPLTSNITPLIQRQSEEGEEKDDEILQAKEMPGQTPTVSPEAGTQIDSMRGGGQPLPETERAFFEPRFGYDFRNVNLHLDSRASKTAKAVNAKAFTIGQDVVFGAGQYVPDSSNSKYLLAHELAHVVQQNQRLPVSSKIQRFKNRKEKTFSNHTSSITNPKTIQRKAVTDQAPEADTVAEVSTHSLIVDDKTEALQQGQMKKGEFLAEVRDQVCQAVQALITRSGRTTDDCPYLEFIFKFLGKRSAQYINETLHRFMPNARGVTSARDYIPTITERVRQSAEVWLRTGEISGLPEGIPTNFRENVLSERSENSSTLNDKVLFKSKPGGARLNNNPQAIKAQLGEGRSIDGSVQSRMSSAFGYNFSHVRIHTDSEATSLSNRHNARAFTVGNHIAFGAGEYQPGTLIGDALIAHELAHVAQQGGATTSTVPSQKGKSEYGLLEEDADLSTMGTVISLWGLAKGSLANIARNAIPRLKTGLRLQRCDSEPKKINKEEAFRYLKFISSNNTIEGKKDSKGKARKIFDLWKEGFGEFILSPRLKILLIKEFLDVKLEEDGKSRIPKEDQVAITTLMEGVGKDELEVIMKKIGEAKILKALKGAQKERFQKHRKGMKPNTTSERELFDADKIIELRDEFIENAKRPKCKGPGCRLVCIDILDTELKKLYAGDIGQKDIKQAVSIYRKPRIYKGRTLGETTLPNLMSYLTDYKISSDPFVTDFTRESGSRKPLNMINSAWGAVVKMVGQTHGWHFFTMSIMDGYHTVSLFVENRPNGVFLFYADQLFTNLKNLVEAGSVPGFKRYSGKKFDTFLEKATQTYWPDYIATCKEKNPGKDDNFYSGKCFPKTTLTIWKLKRKGVPSPTSHKTKPKPPKTYKVKPEDTLSKIARKYEGLTVKKIQDLNKMGSRTMIIKGQPLILSR